MAESYQHFAQHPEYPTDGLIAPFISLCELISRVSEYFSYDDIDNADIQGERLIEMATSNFHGELERIKGVVPAPHKDNGQFQAPEPA